MELWDTVWDLHRDRPGVLAKVKHASSIMLRDRNHGNVHKRVLLEAFLTLLEYSGDFLCQLNVLTMILQAELVLDYRDWVAPVWFKDMPNSLSAFLNLRSDDNEAVLSEFLKIYNSELDMQFLLSVRCFLVKWNDMHLEHDKKGAVWLHLNCGTKSISVTGLEKVPPEMAARKWFILRSYEVKKVEVHCSNSPPFGKMQGINIFTAIGKLFVHLDPLIEDWSMFTFFVNYISISKATVQIIEVKSNSDAADCNGNSSSEPSRNAFNPSVIPCHVNSKEDTMAVLHQAQNSVIQVTSSQDDARKNVVNIQGEAPMQMCSDSDNNDVEICHHFKRESRNESCHNSDTADESHEKYSSNNSVGETNVIVNPICKPVEFSLNNKSCIDEESAMEGLLESSAVGIGTCKTLGQDVSCPIEPQHHVYSDNALGAAEDSTSLQVAINVEKSEPCDLDDCEPTTEEENTLSQIIAATGNELQATKVVQRPFKRKGRHSKVCPNLNVPRRALRSPRTALRSPRTVKKEGEVQEDAEKSDDEFYGTPRRETRAYTNYLKEVLPNTVVFKTPLQVPKVLNKRRLSRGRKRKSTNPISEVDTGMPPAIGSSVPAEGETTTYETSSSKSSIPSSGDDSGNFTDAPNQNVAIQSMKSLSSLKIESKAPDDAEKCYNYSGNLRHDTGAYENMLKDGLPEALEGALPSPVPHPLNMPTLNTPMATPVRDPNDSLMQPDFCNIHEKLNEEMKLVPPGPPPAIPLHPWQRSSGCRDVNSSFLAKSRRLDVEDDTDLKSENGDLWDMHGMDSSSDTSYLENTGSAVLLPIEECPTPSIPSAVEVPPPGEMNNLEQFSEICSSQPKGACQ